MQADKRGLDEEVVQAVSCSAAEEDIATAYEGEDEEDGTKPFPIFLGCVISLIPSFLPVHWQSLHLPVHQMTKTSTEIADAGSGTGHPPDRERDLAQLVDEQAQARRDAARARGWGCLWCRLCSY